MYVDGLIESIKAQLTHYRKQDSKMTYLDVVKYEREEGDALWAYNRNSSTGRRLQAKRRTIQNRNRELKQSALTME